MGYSMPFSLGVVVKNLTDNDLKCLSHEFNGEQLNLVKRKGVYSYGYMDRFEKCSKDKLPDKFKFYSFLKNEYIIKRDYLHALDCLQNEYNGWLSWYLFKKKCSVISCFWKSLLAHA